MPLIARQTRRTIEKVSISLAVALGAFLAVPAWASPRLSTFNYTVNSYDGGQNYIYIDAADRETLYTYPTDLLEGVTIKYKNNNGHSCNDLVSSFSVKDIADVTHSEGATSDPFNVTSGSQNEVYMPWEGDSIPLDEIKEIHLSRPSCWGSLSVEYNSTNVWGANAGTYYGTSPKDPYIAIFGRQPDARDNPIVEVTIPYQDETHPASEWNAPYWFRITTDVPEDEYPDEQVMFRIEIYKGETLVFEQDYSDSNLLIDGNYALLLSSPITFTSGSYSMRGKAWVVYAGNWGDWGAARDFSVTEDGAELPPFEWAPGPEWTGWDDFGVWLTGWVEWFIVPPDNSFDGIKTQLDRLGGRYPFSRVFDLANALTEPFDATAGTSEPPACSFFDGSCVNPTWIRHTLQDFYNANPALGTAFVMVIWFLAVATVLGDISAVFL